MDLYVIVLRVLHIFATVFWFGAAVTFALFIAPSAAAVRGPSDPWRVQGICLEDRLGAMQVSLRSRLIESHSANSSPFLRRLQISPCHLSSAFSAPHISR